MAIENGVMHAHNANEVHARFQEAFNLGDVEALASFYEPNAVLIVGGRPVRGRQNIRSSYLSLLSGGARMTLATRSLAETDGIALLYGEWFVERTSGVESHETTRGISTEVIRKQPDGTWLFIIDDPYSLGANKAS